MVLVCLQIALLVLPGAASEAYYLRISGRDAVGSKLVSAGRGLCFGAAVLLLRCLISMSRGYGGLPIEELFTDVEKTAEYILLSFVMSFLMPNVLFLATHLLKRVLIRDKATGAEEGR